MPWTGSQGALSGLAGVGMLAASVLADQLGLPLPAIPALLVAGALASGNLNLGSEVFAASVAAATVADYVWYVAGRQLGHSAITILCAISLKPEKCVADTELRFNRWGSCALILAKFVPGLSAIAPALAGALRMSGWRFLYLTLAASALWTGVFLLAGLLLGREIREMLPRILEYAGVALVSSAVGLAIYIGLRCYQRYRGRPSPLPQGGPEITRERVGRRRI